MDGATGSTQPGGACGVALPPPGDVVAPPRTSRSKRKLQDLLGIDLRSMALFRVALGSLIIADLINRARDLTAHYTDAGIMPRLLLLQNFGRQSRLSLHVMAGDAWFQALLFLLAGALATMLIVGYRTRLVTFASWVMLCSLHNRNPIILQAGDALLRMLVFWAMFLPLGARFSIDSALNKLPRPASDRYVSVATFCILMQVCFVYWFTAAMKTDGVWWEGQAVWYALQADLFATSFGVWLRDQAWALPALTYATIYLEIFGPILAFSPVFTGPIRAVVVLLFIGFHGGLALSMELGLFPYISMCGWLVFVPTWCWDRLFTRWNTPQRTGVKAYYDGQCELCRKLALIVRTFLLLPTTPLRPAQDDERIHALMREQHSWVLVDHEGKARFKFDAFVYVLRMSPWVWPIAWLAALPPMRWLGTKVYEWIASHRGESARMLRFLKPRKLIIEQDWVSGTFCILALTYVLMWNLRTLDFDKWEPYFPQAMNPYGRALRLDQKWNMFSPRPLTGDGWFIVAGRKYSGETVDLLNDGLPVTLDKPALVSAQFSSYRWRKYLMNLRTKNYAKYRQSYLRYVRNEWNARHAGTERVEAVSLVFMREMTRDGFIDDPKRVVLAVYPKPEPQDAAGGSTPAPADAASDAMLDSTGDTTSEPSDNHHELADN